MNIVFKVFEIVFEFLWIIIFCILFKFLLYFLLYLYIIGVFNYDRLCSCLLDKDSIVLLIFWNLKKNVKGFVVVFFNFSF